MGERPVTFAGKILSFVLTNDGKAQQTTLAVGADEQSADSTQQVQGEQALQLGKILFFALLGGSILNLMPCVLPFMGMKLSSVLHSGSDKNKVRLRFLATSAAILTSFALLATMITLLKLIGSSLGWGVQFQNPWFIGSMVAVTFIFSMNLFEIFEMLLLSSAVGWMAIAGGSGIVGSFCEGVFATLLATPCSAPFLGTAVAFALAAPPSGTLVNLPGPWVGNGFTLVVRSLNPENGNAAPSTWALDEYTKNGTWFNDASLQLLAGNALEPSSGRHCQRSYCAATDFGGAYYIFDYRQENDASLLAGCHCAGRLWRGTG